MQDQSESIAKDGLYANVGASLARIRWVNRNRFRCIRGRRDVFLCVENGDDQRNHEDGPNHPLILSLCASEIIGLSKRTGTPPCAGCGELLPGHPLFWPKSP